MVTQEWVNDVLKKIGDRHLKREYKNGWSEDNPTYGYCYIFSEFLYHFVYLDSEPYYIAMPDGITHWYLKSGDEIIDFTGVQFEKEPDYSQGKRNPFFTGSYETARGKISKRGYNLTLDIISILLEKTNSG